MCGGGSGSLVKVGLVGVRVVFAGCGCVCQLDWHGCDWCEQVVWIGCVVVAVRGENSEERRVKRE